MDYLELLVDYRKLLSRMAVVKQNIETLHLRRTRNNEPQAPRRGSAAGADERPSSHQP